MEAKTKLKRKFCGLHSLGGRLEGPGGPRFRAIRLRCKSWTCPSCALKRARRLKRAIVEQSTLHGLDRFLTLTMDPSKGSREESWDEIKRAWKKFQIYLTRKYGKGLKWLWVIEAQKNGYAHLHILIDRYVPQGWVKEAWDSLGGGRIVFITRANIERTGLYLAKYLTKGFDGGLKPGQRRYGSSRSVKLTPQGVKKEGVWIVVKAPLELLFSRVKGSVTGEFRDREGGLEGFECVDPPVFIPH